MIWFVVAGGIFNVIMSLIMNTKNVRSAVIFKVIPFLLGLGCLLFSAGYFDIL